jgi:hypothetical protein
MKLVDDARDWSKWWSVRLSILGGALLTLAEGFPHALATIYSTLPNEVTQAVPDGLVKVIGIICVVASPIARVIKQSDLGSKGNRSD